MRSSLFEKKISLVATLLTIMNDNLTKILSNTILNNLNEQHSIKYLSTTLEKDYKLINENIQNRSHSTVIGTESKLKCADTDMKSKKLFLLLLLIGCLLYLILVLCSLNTKYRNNHNLQKPSVERALFVSIIIAYCENLLLFISL